MASNDQAAQCQLNYIVDRYLDGECASFAQALSDLTLFPIVLFRLERDHGFLAQGFPRHAAVRIKNDLFLDASGTFTLKQAKGRFETPLVIDAAPDLGASPFESQWPELDDHQETLDHARQMLALRGLEELKAARPRPSADSLDPAP